MAGWMYVLVDGRIPDGRIDACMDGCMCGSIVDVWLD